MSPANEINCAYCLLNEQDSSSSYSLANEDISEDSVSLSTEHGIPNTQSNDGEDIDIPLPVIATPDMLTPPCDSIDEKSSVDPEATNQLSSTQQFPEQNSDILTEVHETDLKEKSSPSTIESHPNSLNALPKSKKSISSRYLASLTSSDESQSDLKGPIPLRQDVKCAYVEKINSAATTNRPKLQREPSKDQTTKLRESFEQRILTQFSTTGKLFRTKVTN